MMKKGARGGEKIFMRAARIFLKGFTLIELLIVIAVLGVLAVLVLVAIDPLEQLARGRDAGRKSSITQLGRALQAYYTTQGSAYPIVNNAWITALVTAGEIKTVPTNPTTGGYSPGCGVGSGNQGGFCYEAGTGVTAEAVVYALLQSKSESAKCPASPTTTYFAWSSADGRAGIVCSEPNPGAQTFVAQ